MPISNELLPPVHQGKRWIRRLDNLNPSLSSVMVYLGMNPSFLPLVPNEITFWYETSDFNEIYQKILHNQKETIEHLITLRSTGDHDYPTLTLMNFVQKSYSNNWQSDKKVIADMLLNKLESKIPGINKFIDVMEIGSPETFERYTGNTDGALNGFENTKEMYGEAKLPITTHIYNLFQTGHWGKPGGGLWNLILNSYNASKTILRNM